MLEISKSIYGTSFIEIDENGNHVCKQIATMNATIPKNGDYNINKIIQERDLFNKNKDIVLEDFNQFETYVYNLANELGDSNGNK